MKGLIQVFYEPGSVFDAVRERRTWVAAFLAGLVLFVAMFAYATEQIGAGNIARHQIEQSKAAASMTQEQKDQRVAFSESSNGKAVVLGFSVLLFVVIMLVFALLFMAVAGVSGKSIKFSQALGTVSYSAWPISVVRSILSVIVIALAADKTELDAQHLLAFNAGAFLDRANTARPLYALASAFDLFTFAQILFAAYGLSRVAQITFTKALVGLGLIWVVFTIIAMGFSLLF